MCSEYHQYEPHRPRIDTLERIFVSRRENKNKISRKTGNYSVEFSCDRFFTCGRASNTIDGNGNVCALILLQQQQIYAKTISAYAFLIILYRSRVASRTLNFSLIIFFLFLSPVLSLFFPYIFHACCRIKNAIDAGT